MKRASRASEIAFAVAAAAIRENFELFRVRRFVPSADFVQRSVAAEADVLVVEAAVANARRRRVFYGFIAIVAQSAFAPDAFRDAVIVVTPKVEFSVARA